jgi:hypothetical protein
MRGGFEGSAAHLLPILRTEAKLFQDGLVQDAFSVRVRGRICGWPAGGLFIEGLTILLRVRHGARERVDECLQEITHRRNFVIRHGVKQHVSLLSLLPRIWFH